MPRGLISEIGSGLAQPHANRKDKLEWLRSLFAFRQEQIMRRYIRHPSDIPIDFKVDDKETAEIYTVKDVSKGGLCFCTSRPMRKGRKISVHSPLEYQIHDSPSQKPTEQEKLFEAIGVVAWCKKEAEGYSVGVQFADPDTQFGVRMVEQTCHIEQYRHSVLCEEGRQLTSEQAAKEWIERFAAEFP